MATVIPFVPLSQTPECDGEPAKVLSLRSRLFERACDEAWAQRLADERETERARYLPARLRLRLVK